MKFVPNAITRSVARSALKASGNAPALLFGVGVAGMIGSTVLACRATLKISDVVDETQSDLYQLEKKKEAAPDVQVGAESAAIYVRAAVDTAKLYAPAVLLGAASVACLTRSHNLLNQRNVALTAAYATVDEAFKTYRAKVVEKYGEEQDLEFRHMTETVSFIDGDTGKTVSEIRVDPEHLPSGYAKFFDEYSTSWNQDPAMNWAFLRANQQYANDVLQARGHLFLNEVYEQLGLPHTKPGAVVGWVMGKGGDNYVDFGIFDNQDRARDFLNGREGSILLDFNVDGVILDLIDPHDDRPLAWQS